ncbi:hypothetical protein [Phycobacter azelaicus]|jgi:hypothetical protein|uniref:hypothetical protein n=1 Tax=Phycobacter azelaicus TaxID=2668075 RepID=UPI00186936A5|nr:hypothetical protein [Phycobacter azelaicus]MBE1295755.1 hypothetical protein [Paracoccaceae bacterium]
MSGPFKGGLGGVLERAGCVCRLARHAGGWLCSTAEFMLTVFITFTIRLKRNFEFRLNTLGNTVPALRKPSVQE